MGSSGTQWDGETDRKTDKHREMGVFIAGDTGSGGAKFSKAFPAIKTNDSG